MGSRQERSFASKARLPEDFTVRLAAKAHYLYLRHKHFHLMLNRPGNGTRNHAGRSATDCPRFSSPAETERIRTIGIANLKSTCNFFLPGVTLVRLGLVASIPLVLGQTTE